MPTRKDLTDLLGMRLPLIQAPMAGVSGVGLAVAVARVGGLGSIPCAMLGPDEIRAAVGAFRSAAQAPLNLNFFVHGEPAPDAAREAAWMTRLSAYFEEFDLSQSETPQGAGRAPFDAELCDLIEDVRPEIVSFHFGLPDPELTARVRATGAKILSSATTPDEARYLEDRGCDAIIAQGAEAGGHRGMFLSDDIATQMGAMALTPLAADAVRIPVIAAGAIADGRSVEAAFALGASGVQVGTAYMLSPECDTSPLHRAALARAGETALTNAFTGRPARALVNRFVREMGPMRKDAPAFPRAAFAFAPLRAAAEARGSDDFSPMWAGQAFAMAQAKTAADVTAELMGVIGD